ncbi:MFS transporter [Candidatus Micrarchaeota archaeon]|nr:MFS transporter [Candidatus Micrarchaeota archaeon]MBU1681437.1 MFS transporter [Candidatus Micrarchaeota archaeon]
MGKQKNGKKNVFLLGTTSFLNDFSSEMIMPILPFFLSSLGAPVVLIGLVGGLRDSLGSILKVLFGYLSDKTGKRKPFVYAGYLTSAFFKLLLAFSPNALFALSSASLERIGKGMRDAPRDAMIGQFMPKKTGTGFGIHQMMDTAGAILGSLAVLLMIWYLAMSYDMIIALAALLAILSIGPLFLVKEPIFKPYQNSYGFRSALSKLPGNLLVFTVIASLFSLANFSYMFFILKAQVSEDIVTAIALYVVFNVFFAIFAYPIGKYADKVGKRKVLIFGYVLFALVSFAFVFYSGLYALLILFILYGIANAAVKGVERAYVVDLSPANLKATSIGTFQLMTGLAALPSSIIAGYLWEAISPEATFMFGAVVSFGAAILLAFKK